MRSLKPASRLGFTIVECAVGVSIIGLCAGAVLYGLNQLNTYAAVNRLYTAAQTLCQNHIDLILTKGPYDPVQNKYPDPNILGTTANVSGGATYTYYSDPSTPSTIYNQPRDVVIYTDPATNDSVVLGRIRTDIKDTGATVSVNGAPVSLDLRQATVTVSYQFRRRNYEVVMNTLRTSDK